MWGSKGLKWLIKGFFMKLLQKSSGSLTKHSPYTAILGNFRKAFNTLSRVFGAWKTITPIRDSCILAHPHHVLQAATALHVP